MEIEIGEYIKDITMTNERNFRDEENKILEEIIKKNTIPIKDNFFDYYNMSTKKHNSKNHNKDDIYYYIDKKDKLHLTKQTSMNSK